MKILICKNYDGLYLTDEAIKRYLEIKGVDFKTEKIKMEEPFIGEEFYLNFYTLEDGEYKLYTDFLFDHGIGRNDECLIKLFEEMGNKISQFDLEFRVLEIPDDVEWFIDGNEFGEYIREVSRTWGLD